MFQPEMAFADLWAAMDNAEKYVKYVVNYAQEKCPSDLEFFNKFVDSSLSDRLTKLVTQPFVRIAYRDAIQLLQEEIALNRTAWQYPDVEFGTDLSTEHERWLAETKFQSCKCGMLILYCMYVCIYLFMCTYLLLSTNENIEVSVM